MSLRARVLLLAIAVEGALLLLAFALAPVLDAPPFARVLPGQTALALGLPATLPLAALFALCVRSRADFCVRIRTLLERSLMPLFEDSKAIDLLLISLLAGLGEEALFRGVLQTVAARFTGDAAGLVLASALFGLAHAVTLGYVLLAAVMGLYLGLLFMWSGDLWLPVIVHAAYDFGALLYLQRRRR